MKETSWKSMQRLVGDHQWRVCVCLCNRLLASQAGSQAHHSHNPLSRSCNQPRKATKVLKSFDPPGNLSLHHISITGISNLPLQVTGNEDWAVSRLVVDFPTCASCLVHVATDVIELRKEDIRPATRHEVLLEEGGLANSHS